MSQFMSHLIEVSAYVLKGAWLKGAWLKGATNMQNIHNEMTRATASILVGSAKTTLMRVGHYGGKNFTHFGSFREIL